MVPKESATTTTVLSRFIVGVVPEIPSRGVSQTSLGRLRSWPLFLLMSMATTRPVLTGFPAMVTIQRLPSFVMAG